MTHSEQNLVRATNLLVPDGTTLLTLRFFSWQFCAFCLQTEQVFVYVFSQVSPAIDTTKPFLRVSQEQKVTRASERGLDWQTFLDVPLA